MSYCKCNHDSSYPLKQVAVSSNTGGAGPLPIITTLFADPINVVSTSINTRGMYDTTNLLLFTCTVNLPLGISVNLNFQIKRLRGDGSSIKVGPTFTFATLAEVLESEAFSFQFADNNVSPGDYTYSIEISTNSLVDITPGASVNNATLTLLAFND